MSPGAPRGRKPAAGRGQPAGGWRPGGPPATARARGIGGLTGTVLLVAALLAAGAATVWGMTVSRDGAAQASAGGWTDAGDASIRLEGAVARDTGHTMPGMDQNLADPVPEGARRLAVTVTLAATAAGGVQLLPEDFAVLGPGVPATEPTRSQLGDGALAEGAATTVELVFDVPADTDTGLVLRYGDARLALPALGPVPDPAPHGQPSGPSPTTVPTPAGPTPSDQSTPHGH